jgi:hypothetical protein
MKTASNSGCSRSPRPQDAEHRIVYGGEVSRSKSKAELEAENADLKDENAELQDQLDTIADIVAPPDEDEDENGSVDDEDEDDDQD